MTSHENNVPRDARVISLILRSLGIEECSPKVIIQLLEFSYKYATEILEDASIYAEYANRKTIVSNDIKLAMQTKTGKYFVSPPPRQHMNDIATLVNSKPLMTYETENLIKIPNGKKALLNLDFEIISKDCEKKKNK
ncbi:hypothetical protein EDEG_00550 [Edhazardia aedis USNM 41457]|uniref:Transcription initiation factor TFIID subunit 9 n=1 Tax=Edhazardia aedis (strain USNM 41457) TaxID=1003232 RepID=J9DF67_EDHAE|nr:hypothetical protein EDEG_00550 [Edhazardia aedis USNM 41457]|eukprot:EJW01250.1 hypothetical protein EDEG_00550 [Edhazardia aedis USNM 41457]